MFFRLSSVLLSILTSPLFVIAQDTAVAQNKQPVDFINPMIGASTNASFGEGKTFPGTATPFGLVQLSPDTTTGGDNGPGYSCEHKTIEGFSFIHMSGIGWYGDLGNLQVMPVVGKFAPNRDETKSPFTHDKETAQAGYYSVLLSRYNILAELTASPHAGILRFTYPKSDTSQIHFDLHRRIGEKHRWMEHSMQHVTMVDDRTIEGWIRCSEKDGGWGRGDGHVNYTLHFYAQFSKPPKRITVWDKDKPLPNQKEYEGRNLGVVAEFSTGENEKVLLKSGVSYVSIDGAKKNLNKEIADWDFDRVRADARKLWATAIEGLKIEGGTDAQKEAYFTAIYHCMIDPRSTSDVDGQYLGADNKPHATGKFVYRTVFSGWDVFRSQFPLLQIIAPEIVNDEINSLVQLADLSGRKYYERWELLNAYSGCMIGHPAVSVLSQAYLAGIRDYDVEKAYEFALNTVDLKIPEYQKSCCDMTRRHLENFGYYPGHISFTLEQAYFDYCAAKMAESLGKKDDAERLFKRAQFYRNIYDPSVGCMRAKRHDGQWMPWKDKLNGEGHGTIESNPYQQGWFVPHDVQGLIDTMGKDYFLKSLTEFFEKTPLSFKWNNYYNHANEPVHHCAYMFVYAGQPWLTQKWTRIVMDHAYGAGVKGLCGNEDVGQMSAWYILSAMGLHPVSPADNVYIIGSPLFTRMDVRLDPKYHKGRQFSIIARDNSPKNVYIQSAKLNGTPLDRAWLTYDEITAGGTLELQMGPEPNKQWASSPNSLPPSQTKNTKK